MLKAGETREIGVTDLDIYGRGIGRADNMAVFVSGLLPGEEGSVRILKVGKRSAEGELSERKTISPDRREPECPHFNSCGGCTLLHASREAELAYKRKRVEDCLQKIGGVEVFVPPVLHGESTLGYRNKASFPVREWKGRARAGYFFQGTGRLADIGRCPAVRPEINALLEAVNGWLGDFHIPAYDEKKHTGLVRRLVARVTAEGKALAALIINGEDVPQKEELVRRLAPLADTLVLVINKQRGADVLTGEVKVLYGSGRLVETILGLQYEISAATFLQVNHAAAQLLYACALDMAALTGEETAADLYCGAGTLSLLIAKHAGWVYGIELVPAAVADAKRNARRNDIQNAEFLCADAGAGFSALLKQGVQPEVVFLDPPRSGAGEKAVAAIAGAAPQKIVYISCDPATLARDVKEFARLGYALQKAQPVDMFSGTGHVETCVLMSRIQGINHSSQEAE